MNILDLEKISELSKLNVLYVEDDDETRDELELVLQRWFNSLYVAVNGQEGLDLYQKHKPDIVITDIQMPKMNGLSMSADIKQINPDQEIIILSAYNDVEYLFRALELGIKHYVTKPISLQRLMEKLSEIKRHMGLESEVKRNRKLLEQYKLLVDEKAIIVKIDQQGRINYVNQQFCHLSGYSESELLGQHYLFGFADKDQETDLEEIKKNLFRNKKWQGILKKTSKKGDTYVVDATVIAILNTENQIEEFVAMMVDMTSMHEKFDHLFIKFHQDLKSQQHYLNEYERAIEIGTSLCIMDTEGKIISANANFCNTLNCQTNDLIGQDFCDIVLDCGDFEKRILNTVRQQGYCSRVISIGLKPGSEHTLSTVIVGIHDQSGKLHSMMSLSQDISESIKLNEEIIETQKELIYLMGEVVENHSQETGMHIKRVAQISLLLAEKYGLSPEHAQMIKLSSPMHDLGKVGIPDDILHKKGKLDSDEYKVMKQHASLGYHMLNKMDRPLIQMAATIAHEHHEFFNGNGYPLGLSGEQIAIEARIVGIVDVFDALSSKRSYKNPWTDEQIVEYLKINSGVQFDPALVDLFLDNLDQIISIRDQLKDDVNYV